MNMMSHVKKLNQMKTKKVKPSDVINKDAIDLLVNKYLTPEQYKEILGPDGQIDTISTFDAVVNYIRKANTEKLKSVTNENKSDSPKTKEPKGLIKISWKDSNTVGFENVSADSVKLLTKAPFKMTDLRDTENIDGEEKSTDFVEIVPKNSTKEDVRQPDSFLNIPEGVEEDTVSIQIKNFINSFNEPSSGSIKSARKEDSPLSESGPQDTSARKKTTEAKFMYKPEDIIKLKNWIVFKQFANMVACFLRQISKNHVLPYSNFELLQQIENKCIEFFVNRSDKSEYSAKQAYVLLFLNLLGKDVFKMPDVTNDLCVFMEELDLLITKDRQNIAGMNLMEPQDKIVRNLLIYNLYGIRYAYLRMKPWNLSDRVSPDLFKTDHVGNIMKHVAEKGNDPHTFLIDNECPPLDIERCFNNLKPRGSILLVE